jgi:predicted nucleic-acid-binding Zn-ribbon protein
MATSKCIKCDSTSFEYKNQNISGKPFVFIQCSKCGGVISALVDHNIESSFKDTQIKLDKLIKYFKL